MNKRLKILSFKAEGTVIPHSLSDVQSTLSKMGHRVFVIDIPAIEQNHLKEIAIMDALVDVNPDMVFTIDTVGLLAYQYVAMRPEMKVVSWFFDNPVGFLSDIDTTLFNSRYHMFCWDRAYEDVVKSLGISRFNYLPFATNPDIYKPSQKEKIYDVSFVGTWSEKRQNVLKELAERGIKIDLFGNDKWLELKHENIVFHGFADNRKDCPEIYSLSKINLNITNEQLLTSLPLRIFDVGACDAFLLTDDQEDAKRIFSEDELVIYKNIDGLVSKINHYLDNPQDREQISCNLFNKISSEFTYEVQLAKLLTTVEQDTVKAVSRTPRGDELISILWKTSLSLMHFQKYEEALSLLSQAAVVETPVIQKKIINALTLAVCLTLAGREKEAEVIINNNEVLKAPYKNLMSQKNYGEFRTALYCLKNTKFTSEGGISNGSPQRVLARNK
ncbi:MAG: glycosyltransferase [Lentisphaeraceae bacterium]|nr:glycosyltransferase [Lentisphaeraceae bacterium]